MRYLITSTLVLFVLFPVAAQINMADSTVQVIGFWNKNEKQSYAVSLEKYKVKGTDTTDYEFFKYDVDITVLDSTADSYTIEWFYRNFDVQSDNKFTQSLMSLSEDLKVNIKTDELGVIEEVVNWQEVSEYIKKGTRELKKEFKDIPKIDEIVNQVETMFTSKQAIESAGIMDAQQFYTFHGAKYKLAEVLEGTIKVPNLFGTEPFDSEFTVYLEEINTDDNNYILRSTQVIDPQQLTDATFKYLVDLSKNMNVKPPQRSDLKDLTNETYTASRIHNSGWVIYSILTKTVSSEGITGFEERIIEIK
jgi:hypothetical protein